MSTHGSIADELITRGWHQGSHEGDDGAVCLEGAVCYALGGVIVNNRPEGLDKRLYRRTLLHVREGLRSVTHLRMPPPTSQWNDAEDRTFDEVLRVAKEADELLAGGER